MIERDQNELHGNHQDLYKILPSVHELLISPAFAPLLVAHSRESILSATRETLDDLRQQIAAGQHSDESLRAVLELMAARVERRMVRKARFSLRRVINATGVILHTNLGRAPLSKSAIEHIAEVSGGYSNLELDLETGERSRRDVHAESLILALLNPETGGGDPGAAIVVNNCAAATFLALNTLAEGGEVIVSRGELIEIGGGFRIPEILAKSGAQLREVGTTNRTRLADYERAISPATRLILRVHQSNFSMDGFVERPALAELISLSRRTNIPLFEDQGTGLLCNLTPFGVSAEQELTDSYRMGADLVAASGDKLLGGPQCGLLAGKTNLIDRVRSNPLFRAFRVDKLTYAALQATLVAYLSHCESQIPIIRMLQSPASGILERCKQLTRSIEGSHLAVEVIPTTSVIGGGTAPRSALPSHAVALRHSLIHAEELALQLRKLPFPVVGRISEDRVLLDLRTVEPELDEKLFALLRELDASTGPEAEPVDTVKDGYMP